MWRERDIICKSFLSLPPIKNSVQVRGDDVIQVLICKSNLMSAKFIEMFYGSVLTKNNTLQNLIEHRVICKGWRKVRKIKFKYDL